jgi:predicted esterase
MQKISKLARRLLVILWMACGLFWGRAIMAKSHPSAPSAVEQANAHWHQAGLAEIRHNNSRARVEYQAVISSATNCERHIREWFVGASELAIARCNARDHNLPEVERAIDSALKHHFWPLEMIRIEPVISSWIDKKWLDSTLDYWTSVRDRKSTHWKSQKPIVIYPADFVTGTRLPLIVALHGGTASYREFADHWTKVADKLHLIVAVPAGAIRLACGLNSWGEEYEAIDKIAMGLIDSLLSHSSAVDSSRIYVAGFSEGAEASLKLALVHPDLIKGAILLSGYIGGEMPPSIYELAAKAGTRIYALSGALEPKSLVKSLEQVITGSKPVGLKMELHLLPASGHEVPQDLTHQMMGIWNWLNEPTNL